MSPHERDDAPPARTSFGALVGRSAVMRALFSDGTRAAAGTQPVLISGEAGTGKDSLARALHAEGARQSAPFVVVDCAATPPHALDEELFGRPDGETRGRAGALELARGGTLLLDEPSDLPLLLQTRLAQALRNGRFARSEGGPEVAADVRLLVVTKRKLTLEVARGHLRADLHALLTVELAVPPLRERRDDVPLIAQALLDELGLGDAFSPEALNLLALHDWPGNVRELRNVLERFARALRDGHPMARRFAALVANGELASVPPALDRRAGDPGTFEPGQSYRDERTRFESAFGQRYVAWLLDRHDGNVSAAARAAEMDRKYLYKLARKHGLKASE